MDSEGYAPIDTIMSEMMEHSGNNVKTGLWDFLEAAKQTGGTCPSHPPSEPAEPAEPESDKKSDSYYPGTVLFGGALSLNAKNLVSYETRDLKKQEAKTEENAPSQAGAFSATSDYAPVNDFAPLSDTSVGSIPDVNVGDAIPKELFYNKRTL